LPASPFFFHRNGFGIQNQRAKNQLYEGKSTINAKKTHGLLYFETQTGLKKDF
jgi:hypothetical protein